MATMAVSIFAPASATAVCRSVVNVVIPQRRGNEGNERVFHELSWVPQNRTFRRTVALCAGVPTGVLSPGQNASEKPPAAPQGRTRGPSPLPFFCEILMTKLHVGKLPFAASEEAVRNIFAPQSTVENLSLIADWRGRRAREALERAELKRMNLAEQYASLNSADLRIRAWERVHQLRLPSDPSHPVLQAIAAATQLTLIDVRNEQRLRYA